jgi:hypothetical protein
MSRARNRLLFLALMAAGTLAGCCERKGLVLRGDFALELNRVNHLLGRHDDYEVCSGDCDCASCSGGLGYDAEGGDAGALYAPEPRLHPVPTRPVFEPQRAAPYPRDEAPIPADPPPTGSQSFRYRNGAPRGPRLANANGPVELELNPASRPSRRRALDTLEPPRKKPATAKR